MIVIICGGRGYTLTAHDQAWLEALHAETPFREVITGGATGADAGAKHWADHHGIDTVTFHPNWTQYGTSAGPRRNARMRTYLWALRQHGADVAVLAFPGGEGTADMVRQAEQVGVNVLRPPPQD